MTPWVYCSRLQRAAPTGRSPFATHPWGPYPLVTMSHEIIRLSYRNPNPAPSIPNPPERTTPPPPPPECFLRRLVFPMLFRPSNDRFIQ